MPMTYYYSAAEALEAIRKDQEVLTDPYRLHEVLAALARGCDSQSWQAGYDAGKRAERGEDDL